MSKRTKLLLKENNKLEDQMDKNDIRVLTDMIVYIRSSNISPYYQEVVRHDICEMLIEGEKRGESAKEVIGEDYKVFCDNIIAEMPQLGNKEKTLSFLRDALISITVLIFTWFGFGILNNLIEKKELTYLPLTLGNIICAVVIVTGVLLFVFITSKKSFADMFINTKITILLVAILIVCVSLNVLITKPIFEIHAIVAIALIVVAYAIYKAIDTTID